MFLDIFPYWKFLLLIDVSATRYYIFHFISLYS